MNEVTKYEPPAAPAEAFGNALMEAMRDPAIPADKLQVVLQARREIMQAQAVEQFNVAFAHMQADIPQVTKQGLVELINRSGEFMGSYRFARWEDMDVVLRPILSRHGFTLSFSSTETEIGTIVIGELAYRGHSKYSRIKLPPDTGPGRSSLQAHGGSLSYGKRYTAELLLNIVRRGMDNDAVEVSMRKVTAQQVSELARLISETRTDVDKFLTNMATNATELGDVLDRDYHRLINALNEKGRKKG
jgi:ERF superfamily